MARSPLRTLIHPRPQPETTLDLNRSVGQPEATVSTYVFTDSIREHFADILEHVVRGEGQGFWIQAEYGAGKTHFLATLACLLAGEDALWDHVGDDLVSLYRTRLRATRLFPVVVSLRGEAEVSAVNARPLFDVLEQGVIRSLEEHGLRDAVRLTLADDLLDWFAGQPEGTRGDIQAYAQRQAGQSLETLREYEGDVALAGLLQAYCGEHDIRPQVASTVKARLQHVYDQLTSADRPGQAYDGLLFVIDEYEGWEKSRPRGSSQQARDEDLLETMAFVLPRGEGLRIFTLVASQTEVPAKLRGEHGGDRFINVALLAGAERDYDLIVSRRVRDLEPERLPEVDEYYHYYTQQFDFARDLSQAQFRDVFPFQPRCFDVVRRITARDLPTARSGILVFWQVLHHAQLLGRDTLIRVADLLESDHLRECLNTTVYRPSFDAYRVAHEGLESLGLDTADLRLAQDVLATLFLWHLAHLERSNPLSLQALAQATLTVSDLLRADDAVALVLSRMRELPQVRLDDQGALFVVTGGDGPTPVEIFDHFREEALRDEHGIAQAWTDALFLTPRDAGGQSGLFGDFTPDEMERRRAEFRHLEYGGEVVVATRWQLDWGLPLPSEDLHFRIVILTGHRPDAVRAADLQDPRIAVIVPTQLEDEPRAIAADYLAWQNMERHYRDRSGPEAEKMREWLNTKRRTVLGDLLMKQASPYRTATVLTRDGLAIDLREAMGLSGTERRITYVVERLLAAAYRDLPIDATKLRSLLRPNDVGKLFGGLFGSRVTSAARAALRNYGVGLGTVHPDRPTGFGPVACQPFDVIRAMLDEYEAQGRELPAWRIYERLSGVPYGLPYPLIQLYLLAFVRHGQPRVELTLKPGHRLTVRGGQAPPRPALTMTSAIDVDWKLGLDRWFDALVPARGPSWNDAVPFAREIKPDLHAATDPAEIERQDAALRVAMETLGHEVETIRGSLGALARSLHGELSDEAGQVLDRVQALGQAGAQGYQPFHERVQEHYASPDPLREDVGLYARLRQLAGYAAEVQEMRAYLDALALRTEDGEMAGDRMLLLGQISLAELERNPALWPSISDMFRGLKARYRTIYQKHHRDTYQGMAGLRARMEDVDRRLHALELLNAIAELGAPVGEDLSGTYTRLQGQLRPCPVTEVAAVDVEAHPVCAACGLSLTADAPAGEVETFLGDLDRALQEQRRRLGAEAVRRVLERAGGDELSRLMEAAHAAEIARLVDVLDERVAESIRRLLVEDGLVTAPAQVFARLAELHPTVGEDEIPATVRDFDELLHQAIEKAQEEHPDKKTVRLSLR